MVIVRPTSRAKRGVTLIMVSGVLVVLAAMGAGFYTLMLAQTKSATRYSDSISAELAMRAGMADAIARLREEVFYHTEDPTSAWYTYDYLHGAQRRPSFPAKNVKSTSTMDKYFPFSRALSNKIGANSEQFNLQIVDAASKININAGDGLGVILDNLCRVIGPPLVCADPDAMQPRSWSFYGASGGLFDNSKNVRDTSNKLNWDLYYPLDEDHDGKDDTTGQPMPVKADGTALYGDGYAIAAYRSKHGRFKNILEIRNALTYKLDPKHPELEQLELDVKISAIKDYLTVDSWVDTSTVCTGKFEWVNNDGNALKCVDPDDTGTEPKSTTKACQVFIDRDKTWIADDPINDPKNERGSLRGCYITIVNGHGAGQLRRIATNGIDWVAIKMDQKMTVAPGPVSSYMIVAREDALRENVSAATSPSGIATLPKQTASGGMVQDPNIDYSVHPLCIHRAPVNINTASDKVLAALFMGVNIQHGHPMAVGTDADLKLTSDSWKQPDPHGQESSLQTPMGLKRIPVSSGRLVLDRPKPWKSVDNSNFDYISNYGSLGAPAFKQTGTATLNEAHELAYRVIAARTRTQAVGTRDPDPNTADAGDGPAPYSGSFSGFERGPFTSWDDLYFRVIKPWDDIRSGYFINKKTTIPNSGTPGVATGLDKASVARLLMANFNPNTDILKFNPNIEWIDRWGRNFTEMEPVMAYTNDAPDKQPGNRWKNPKVANPITTGSKPVYAVDDTTNRARGTVYLMPDNIQNVNDPDAGTYVIRSFRYRSDEMIDKTDLNRSTTEFAFDSKGIFEIQVAGRVVKDGETQSERKAEALVKVYDVWRETTQSQFVKGRIQVGSGAPACTPETTYAGQISRDAVNVNQLQPLTTLPEPLVPVGYRVNNTKGIGNTEVVDPQRKARDVYGEPKQDPSMPDVVANRVLPAIYDGQIVLATNTLGFDPSSAGDKDTFLASFNGDLDTDTCLGNGREQAKMPHTENNDGYKFRVIDTCGLLGAMNDSLIDIDTDLPANPAGFQWTTNSAGWDGWSAPPAGTLPGVYRFQVLSDCLKALNKDNYWENVTLRQGDLRPDGVYLTSPGVSGNEATLKYCFGDDTTRCQDSRTPGKAKLNFDPGSADGNLVTMWMKPVWHHNDHQTHPFFDATNPGFSEGGTSCRACYLKKHGSTVWALGWGPSYVSGNRRRTDDLNFSLEGNTGLGQQDQDRDKDLLTQLHGGVNWVPKKYLWRDPNTKGINTADYAPKSGGHEECPSYRVQPFRWSFVGVRFRFNQNPGANGAGGHWVSGDDGANGLNKALITKMAHPFIDTQTNPENQSVGVDKFLRSYWSSLPNAGSGFTQPCDIGDTGFVNCAGTGTVIGDSRKVLGSGFGVTGQPVKWKWADPAGVEDPCNKIFGVNNLNQDVTTWIYHHLPQDGTYAVIDELKISSKEYMLNGQLNYTKDRGVREQTLSRYYMPPNPEYRDACPTFTSQTMLESLKGQGSVATAAEFVTVARVTWTVFTPRFLHENIQPVSKRKEWISRNLNGQSLETNNFRGPFDYDKYNEVYYPRESGDIFPFGVDRPTPKDYNQSTEKYVQPHYNRGVEVEVLNDAAPISGSSESYPQSGVYADNKDGIFSNPDLINRFVDRNGKSVNNARVRTDKLRYRVRFRYPVDQLVDPGAGKRDGKMNWVDASQHYLLDTPVFDDISVTYFIAPQILSYKELAE